jgi:hypothetical protein
MAVRDVVQAAAGQGGDKLYVEDVFSTYLYKGNGSTQTITNGIDLDGEGGMVWLKSRSHSDNHGIFDAERGVSKYLIPSTTGAEGTASGVSSFNSSGFSLGSVWNDNNKTYASWTFRKAPKFFDVVTYTGTGTARTVSHNLGSVPGTIIVKVTDNAGGWQVYHRSTGATEYLVLNETQAAGTSSNQWNNTAPTDSVFTVGNIDTNESGRTYVAYLFAHDAGGFGEDGEQNIISCGSYTGNDSYKKISLGFEPQMVLVKAVYGTYASGTGWRLFDNMRGGWLYPNSSTSENGSYTYSDRITYEADGFSFNDNQSEINKSSHTYIYIAIRRGLMKKPESGTEVYYYATQDATSPGHEAPVANWPVDFAIKTKTSSADNRSAATRLLGEGYLVTNATDAFASNSDFSLDYQNGFFESTDAYSDRFAWMFRRAPGFFDVVAYTGSVSSQNISHNLSAQPEIILIKKRTSGNDSWIVQVKNLGARKYLILDSSEGAINLPLFNGTDFFTNTLPTSSVFTVGGGEAGGGYDSVGSANLNYVAYLFATLAGVSKVGSYTGTGADLNVDCGFSAGARFILIKRTDASGDWYVWDSARGIVAGNDPYLLLNSTAAQVTNTDYIDPLASGFTVTSSAPAAINASGGSYIFLAIA